MNSLKTVSRRRALKTLMMGSGALMLLAGCERLDPGSESSGPKIKVSTPSNGAGILGGVVPVEAQVFGFRAAAGTKGRINFFVDVPASSVAAGQPIPTDQPDKYVNGGVGPSAKVSLPLPKGVHTITVVVSDADGKALAEPAPVSIQVLVR